MDFSKLVKDITGNYNTYFSEKKKMNVLGQSTAATHAHIANIQANI
jgi:hypothetical protein